MKDFLVSLFEHFYIEPTNGDQVALIQFFGNPTHPPSLNWNLQSMETLNQNNLFQNIRNLQSIGGDGSIQNAFNLALTSIIGSSYDRPNAPNVVLTLGDGGAPSIGMTNLAQMDAANDR